MHCGVLRQCPVSFVQKEPLSAFHLDYDDGRLQRCTAGAKNTQMFGLDRFYGGKGELHLNSALICFADLLDSSVTPCSRTRKRKVQSFGLWLCGSTKLFIPLVKCMHWKTPSLGQKRMLVATMWRRWPKPLCACFSIRFNPPQPYLPQSIGGDH